VKYERSYTFPCEHWLSLFKEDCQVSRKLNAVTGKNAKQTTYEITVVTGKKFAVTLVNKFCTFLYSSC